MALRNSFNLVKFNTIRQTCRVLSTNINPDVQTSKASDFPGAKGNFVSEIKFLNENSYEPIPVYRVINSKGDVVASSEEPNLSDNTLINMYKTMLQLNQMDKILYESQRQGRISFYMTNYCEEGVQIGTAEALAPQDLIYAQYREAGVFLYRGMTVRQLINQCYGNLEDRGKGRQMPVHYGNKDINMATISSPLATQMPQAVGSAYAFKMQKNNDKCVVCFFGEGAASEGDAHAAFNFAATLDCPIVFICRNNGYAISTPSNEQYRGDGIGARGPSLGINTVRVDGTDALAVYNAVKKSREFAIQNNKPVLIEAMAYRVSHHSTSDDSSAYRPIEEIEKWSKEESPVQKLRMYIEHKGLWSEDAEKSYLKETRDLVLKTMKESENIKKPNWKELFEDVYYDMPPRLRKQMQLMEKHVEKYKEHYPTNNFEKDK